MKKYRIKTEGEFIAEFGDNWKNVVEYQWATDDAMDYLFNQPLDEIITPESLKLVEKQIDFTILRTRCGWSVSKGMITELKKAPNTKVINAIR